MISYQFESIDILVQLQGAFLQLNYYTNFNIVNPSIDMFQSHLEILYLTIFSSYVIACITIFAE